jgi:CRP/FNR family transcriptional regulator, cyclic AMP receptor protein
VNTWDAIGYVASSLVLTAFGMKSIIPLRVVAMCSNLVFIIYGLGLGLTPIWCLHAALLPMNAWRLVEALGTRKLLPVAQTAIPLQFSPIARP